MSHDSPNHQPPIGLTVSDLRELRRNTLRGFCSVAHPSGLIFHEVALHHAGGRSWASPPARPMLSRDNAPMLDAAGKKRWQTLIDFAPRERRDTWSRSVIAAVERTWPALLVDDGGPA